MPSLKDIRKRIGSVKNTQKITRAMKMVAAARLRKAQVMITELRPYALKTLEVLSEVATRAGDEEVHPLLASRPPKKVLLLVLTSDRGLAGAFNASVCKLAFNTWKELNAQGSQVSFAVIGRKGRDFLRRRGADIRHEFTGIFEEPSMDRVGEIGRTIVGEYVKTVHDPAADMEGPFEPKESEPELDAVYLIYNEFKSAISQAVVKEQLLPIQPMELSEDESAVDFIYEPSKRALLDRLLPMYVEIEVFRAVLESVASEHGARMTAMDNATKNAAEMIDALTLQYNRARQAAITKELMEIIGGAEALKG